MLSVYPEKIYVSILHISLLMIQISGLMNGCFIAISIKHMSNENYFHAGDVLFSLFIVDRLYKNMYGRGSDHRYSYALF